MSGRLAAPLWWGAFAALEVATGKIAAYACYQRHRNSDFLAFLIGVYKISLALEFPRCL